MPLKPLDEFNAERSESYAIASKPHPNGIACPKCGAECVDSNPGITLTSNPPRAMIACSKCDFVGSRVC